MQRKEYLELEVTIKTTDNENYFIKYTANDYTCSIQPVRQKKES